MRLGRMTRWGDLPPTAEPCEVCSGGEARETPYGAICGDCDDYQRESAEDAMVQRRLEDARDRAEMDAEPIRWGGVDLPW